MATATPLLDRSVDTSWNHVAACRDADDTLFFHPEGERGSTRRRRAEAAKAICRSCPVMMRCRDEARARREAFGTWGGESQFERGKWLAQNDRKQDPHPQDDTDDDPQDETPQRPRVADRTPCTRCGRIMRTRTTKRRTLADIGPEETFHRAHGECQSCNQATLRRTFTARWEITDLGADMTLAQLIAEACNGRVQEAARAQRVQLECQPQDLAFRIDSAAGQLVATGRARALDQGAEVSA